MIDAHDRLIDIASVSARKASDELHFDAALSPWDAGFCNYCQFGKKFEAAAPSFRHVYLRLSKPYFSSAFFRAILLDR
jgi:hypothetical protein